MEPGDISYADYNAMTVNERLANASLLSDWDKVVLSQNREGMIAILMRVALSHKDAVRITDSVLANPSSYGF